MFKLLSKVRSYQEMVFALGVLTLVLPLTQGKDSTLANFLFSFFFLLVLISCIRTVSTRGIAPRKKLTRIIIFVAGACALGLDITDLIFGGGSHEILWMRALSTASYATLLAFVCAIVTRDLFSGKKVTADKIYGSITIYLLLGIFWVCLYGLLAYIDPNAIIHSDGTPVKTFSPFIYFSFTTLTTLGYGDIVPQSKMAMSLTNLEAICGQFFMAVVVARLVGLFTAQAMFKHK